MAANTTPKTTTHTVAKFIGHAGTERIITKADQDGLIGVAGAASKDLVWGVGNQALDVTDVDETVLDYLKSDEEFKLRTVTVNASEASAEAAKP